MYVGVPSCMPVLLVEISCHVLFYVPIILGETPVLSVETPVHVLPCTSVYVLPQGYLLILLFFYLSVNILMQASVHVPLSASVLTLAVLSVCLLFCPTHSCDFTLDMYLGQVMSNSGVLSGIPCIIARNLWNVVPYSGFVHKSAYISPVRQYFSEK